MPAVRRAPHNPRRLVSCQVLLAAALCTAACETRPGGARSGEAAPLGVDMHLMGTCPFARHALQGLLPALRALGPAVELRLHHIGGVQGSGALHSMYGERDLEVDRLQLCAAELGGQAGLRALLECQLASDDEAEAARCTAGAAVERAALRACAGGPRGQALLEASFARSRAKGLRASPTFFVAGAPYDDGYSTAHFTRALCAALPDAGRGVPVCAAPPPVQVRVTLVTDRRCDHPSCETARFERFVRKQFAGATLERVDWSEARARALYAAAGQPALPFAVLSGSARRDDYGYPAVAKQVRPLKGGRELLLPLGQRWRPDGQGGDALPR